MSMNVVIEGNLARDPDTRVTRAGNPMTNVTVVVSDQKKDQYGNWVDDSVAFIRVTGTKRMAENMAESLSKGTRVIAQGRLKRREYTRDDGTTGESLEMFADAIGVSLKFDPATPGYPAPNAVGFDAQDSNPFGSGQGTPMPGNGPANNTPNNGGGANQPLFGNDEQPPF